MCKLLVGLVFLVIFSFGIIFQQFSLRMVTHCAGGFLGEWWGNGGLVILVVGFNAPQMVCFFEFAGFWCVI